MNGQVFARIAPRLGPLLLFVLGAGCGDEPVTALRVSLENHMRIPADQVRIRKVTLGSIDVPTSVGQVFPQPARAIGSRESLVIWFPDDAARQTVDVEAELLRQGRVASAPANGGAVLVARATVNTTVIFLPLGPEGDGGAGAPDAAPPSDARGEAAADPPDQRRDDATAPDGPRADASAPDGPRPTDGAPPPDVRPPPDAFLPPPDAPVSPDAGPPPPPDAAPPPRDARPPSPDAPPPPPDLPPPSCGDPGEACCSGSRCNGGGCCAAGTCVASGAVCPGNQTCVAGSCTSCGGVGQGCCANIGCTAPRTTCAGQTCVRCGTNNDPCCANAQCDSGLFCDSGTCAACGGNGQRCCPGASKCTGNLCCNVLNTCVDPTLVLCL